MSSHNKQVESFMETVRVKNSNEPEFLQAVNEVAESVIPFISEHKKYQEERILERIVEPERVVIFRVPWVDDKGIHQVNRGFRVEMNSAIGPYKGGLRFHPTVNLSILKFLAFEQVFKNSLTTLPLGGGKGGSDFDPKGKSDHEVMKFCQSFMTELGRHLGSDTDIPAGDIGVGAREIGYLFGQYKRIHNRFEGVLTGKGLDYGGSLIRTEATGYGTVYFAKEALQEQNRELEGMNCAVSGSGNVAQYTIEKLLEFGAKPLTISDSQGYIFDKDGIDTEKLAYIKELKNVKRGRIKDYASKYTSAVFTPDKTPWNAAVDLAFPCATQNEMPLNDTKTLVENGCFGIFEGANMPLTKESYEYVHEKKLIYTPGKASNAGGVATSGLEMVQNAQKMSWTRKQVDDKLQEIMKDIHKNCLTFGKQKDNYVDYVKGANIAGFVKVADAMIAQGSV